MPFSAGAIVSKLTLDRTKFSAGVKAVQKQTRTLGGWVKKNSAQFKAMGLAAAAAGTAALVVFTKMVKQYVEVGDMVHKMALRTGFAATTLSELAYAADISGADITMLEKGVKKMSKTIVDASYGLETYLRVFRSLGLDIQELLKLSPEEQFLKIGAAIADMESDTLRTAAAVDVFGRSGTMLLPLFKEGSEGIAKLREEAHRLGIIFDEEAAAKAAKLKDAQTALKGSVQGLSIAILNDLIPVLTDVTKRFTDFFVASRVDAKNWAIAIVKFFEIIAKGAMKLLAGLQILQSAVFEMAAGVVGVFREYIEQLIIGFGVLAKVGVPVKGLLKDLMQAWVDLSAVEKGYIDQMNIHIDRAADIIAGFQGFFTMLEQISKGLKDAKTDSKGLGDVIGESLLPPARALGNVFEDMIGAALPAARKLPGLFENVVTDMETNVEGITTNWKEGFWNIYRDATIFTSALGSLFDQLAQNQMMNIQNEYEARKKAIENSMMTEKSKADAMEKLDKDFEKKRKKAMREQAARTKAVGIMESIIHTASAIVEALPNIPLAIAVGIMGAAQTALIAAQPLPGFQRGGRMEEGEPGVVGERGPEIFAPERPGTIIPIRERALGALGSVNLSFAPVFYLTSLDPQTARDVVREQVGPELLEMFKTKIMLPEFQDALRIK